MKAWLATRLRWAADRMDPAGAPRLMGWTFTFEKGIGIKFRDDHRGCSLWRLGDSDFGRAWTDADTDWDVER